MATGPAPTKPVEPNDWQAVEPSDWQTVTSRVASPAPGVLRPLTEKEQMETTYAVGAKGEGIGENIHNAARDAFTGAYGVLAHPIRTAEGMVRSVLPAPVEKAVFGSETPNPIQSTYEGLNTRPGETLSTMAGQAAVIDPALRVGGAAVSGARGLAPRIAEAAQKGAQGLVGAGERSVTAAVAKDATEAGKAASDAIKANREAAAKHATNAAEVRAANNEAVRAQGKIAPTQEKLKTAGRELQAQIETARNNALREGNAKYSAVNAKLNPIEADPEFYTNSLVDAAENIAGSAPEPTILKNIKKRIETGDPIRYEDLQADYSLLGKELSKGTLAGPVYHAYDQMHESIGGEMQRIADAHGQGPQLVAAQNYWRRMKQAFGRPYNPSDTGNMVLEKATGQASADEQANRVRLLGSFDKSIPQTVEHIGNLREGLGALPDAKPLRDVVKPAPPKPQPTQIHAPTVNTRAIREALLDKWTHGESELSKFQVRSLVGGGLGAVVGGLFEGRVGAGVGGVIGTTMGPVAIARLVEVPAVREWLTRPPKGELETLRKLPSADRLRIVDTLGKVVDQAATFGKPIKVSPAITALIAGGLAPRQNPTDEWAQSQR